MKRPFIIADAEGQITANDGKTTVLLMFNDEGDDPGLVMEVL